MTARTLLFIGGVANILVGALHVAIAIIGPWAYRYFGAGEDMARMAEKGSIEPAAVTLVLAIVFAVFGVYGVTSRIGSFRLPVRKIVLWLVAGAYLLRGLMVLQQVYFMVQGIPGVTKDAVFSAVSLGIGVCYLVGVLKMGEE